MTEAGTFRCFSVVANVGPEAYGHGGHVGPSAGTKNFSAGTKVHCEMPQWGDGGERLWVVGRRRGSSRLIRIVMPSERLVNWRVQGVYSAVVYDMLKVPWPDKETAEWFAESAAARTKAIPNVQAAGQLVTRCYRQLDAGGASITQLEHEAAAVLASFPADAWEREPRGPASLQALATWLGDTGVTVPSEDLAAIVIRRARHRDERARQRRSHERDPGS